MKRLLQRSLDRSLYRVAREIASESQSVERRAKSEERAIRTLATQVRVGLWFRAVLANSKIVKYLPRELATLGLGRALPRHP